MRYIIIVLLLSGCSVNSDDIYKAEKLCKVNEGIDVLYIDIGKEVITQCKNGAKFYP